MPDYVTVAHVGDIPEGRGKAFQVGEVWLAIFLVEGKYYALDNYCPHMGAPLHTGDIHRGAVVCNRHMWAFRLEDGVCTDAPTLQATPFPVRVVGEAIQVSLP